MRELSAVAVPGGIEAREAPAELHLGLACLMIAAGGVLLGLQVDQTGALAGTGYISLGIGAVVALFAALMPAARRGANGDPGEGAARDVGWLPREPIAALSALCGFCGIAFIVAGVLAPGGGWMFFEVLLLVGLLARRRTRPLSAGPRIGAGLLAVLALMLLFRLWITWQGSEHRWQVMTIPIPGLSAIPLEFLQPVQSVSLGSFTPRELGFPPAGVDFPLTLALWAGGFALCAMGLWWRESAALEHENDRIHATIQELPPQLALLVEKLLPEERWPQLGLHGLSERRRRKRIEALVTERIARRREVDAVLHSFEILAATNPGGFTGEIYRALLVGDPPKK